MLERDLRLVELTGARYHAAHLSTAEGVELIRQAKRSVNTTLDIMGQHYIRNRFAELMDDFPTLGRLQPDH
jgi:dihydroorotase